MSGFKIHNDQQAHFITFAVVDWIDVFTRPTYKNVIVESLKFCQQNKGLRIHGWCLMSNHIHLMVSAREGHKLSSILRDLKSSRLSAFLKTWNPIQKKAEENGCFGCLKRQEVRIQTTLPTNFGDMTTGQWR
jgi:REP element-mobilizing transposase RayT